MSLELFVVNFEKEKMVLRVPLDKAKQVGMRKLADGEVMEGAMKTCGACAHQTHHVEPSRAGI